jgi:hypothetical protein
MKLAILLVLALSATAAADPSKQDALDVVDKWVKAQNDGDFTAYGALYDAKFVGIKRTNDGGSKSFTLAKWKADRKKMFKATQKVAADQPTVLVKGNQATLKFVQRYQTGSYADHGDKALVLRTGSDGVLKIVREEMLYSAPGWDADPKAEVDASALASPITVKVRETSDPAQVGDCGTVFYTLELTDAKGKKMKQDIGGGVISVEQASGVDDADTSGDKLFKLGEWCAGGADYYEIVHNGDAIVVRYKGEDEPPPDEAYEPPTWNTQLTVKLPAGAKLK